MSAVRTHVVTQGGGYFLQAEEREGPYAWGEHESATTFTEADAVAYAAAYNRAVPTAKARAIPMLVECDEEAQS